MARAVGSVVAGQPVLTGQSVLVQSHHRVVSLLRIELVPAWACLVKQPVAGSFVVIAGIARRPGIATDRSAGQGLAIVKDNPGLHRSRAGRNQASPGKGTPEPDATPPSSP